MRPMWIALAAVACAPFGARAADDHPLGRAQELLAEVAPLVEKA